MKARGAAAACVVALAAAATTLAGTACSREDRPIPVPVEGSPALGPADAWVTMVELADFQCPYCARAALTLHEALAAWPDDLRLVFKHFPLTGHRLAMGAAAAAECAGEQGRFWEMHDAIFADQDALGSDALRATAERLGLDMAAYDACLISDPPYQRINADKELAKRLGVRATPSLYVNGWLASGAPSAEELRALIERELAVARASGIPRGEYYDQAVLGL